MLEFCYDDWVDCVDNNKCGDCDISIPGRSAREAQTPGAKCDIFVPWYLDNFDCCDGRCNDELDDFAISPPPTSSPTAEEPPTGKVAGIVFEDVNGNKIRDPREPGIGNVDVVITGSSDTLLTVTTGPEVHILPKFLEEEQSSRLMKIRCPRDLLRSKELIQRRSTFLEVVSLLILTALRLLLTLQREAPRRNQRGALLDLQPLVLPDCLQFHLVRVRRPRRRKVRRAK